MSDTVQDIKDKPEQMPVIEVTGKITKVSEKKSGEGKFGPWSLQFMKFQDETGEISVMAKNRDEDFSDLEGSHVAISAVQSKQHGWVGAESYDNEYRGESERVLKLTGAGKIEQEGDKPAAEGTETPEESISEEEVTTRLVKVSWQIAKDFVAMEDFKELAMNRYGVSSSSELSLDELMDLVQIAGKANSEQDFRQKMEEQHD